MLTLNDGTSQKYHLLIGARKLFLCGELCNVHNHGTKYTFTSDGKYYEFAEFIMSAIANDVFPFYKGLVARNSENKRTLLELKNRVTQLLQQFSTLNSHNEGLVVQNNNTIHQMRSANEQIVNRIRNSSNTLKLERNSAIQLKAKTEQLHIENATTVKIYGELKNLCDNNAQRLAEVNDQLQEKEQFLQQSEEVVAEKEKKIALQQLKIRELEEKLKSLVQENGTELKLLETDLAQKARSCKQDRDRIERVSRQSQNTVSQLRKTIASYDTYPSSECTTDLEEDLA